jgi:hypothetical protein
MKLEGSHPVDVTEDYAEHRDSIGDLVPIARGSNMSLGQRYVAENRQGDPSSNSRSSTPRSLPGQIDSGITEDVAPTGVPTESGTPKRSDSQAVRL